MPGLAGPHGQADREVCFAGARSGGDTLQQLRAVLPCDVRVIAETHPLFGRLLAARSFKRWNGVLLLVVDLPDGSSGTIRADATMCSAAVGPRARCRCSTRPGCTTCIGWCSGFTLRASPRLLTKHK